MDGDKLKCLVSPDVLQKSLQKFTKTTDFRLCEDAEVNMATSGVEGILSTVLRVKAFYSFDGEEKVHSKRFICKVLPITTFAVDFLKCRGVFQREALYFERVSALMEETSAGRVQVPLPKCYHAKYGGVDDIIVMEDLSEGGYCTPDRVYLPKGLDLAHCELAMRCLGRIHGLGVAAERSFPPEDGTWIKLFPSLGKEAIFYTTGPGETDSPALSLTENTMKTLLELSAEIEGLPMEAKASGMLEKVVEGAWRTLCKLVESSGDGPKVLTHGDYWMFNLMFKYGDDGSGGKVPVDVKAIDLQLSRYCHPVIDILYFMYICTKKSLRDAHFQELLSVYHDSLVKTLEAVGGGPPPFSSQELIRDARGKYKPFGALIGAIFAPGLLLGDDFVPTNIDELSDEKLKEVYAGNSSKVRKLFATDPKFRSGMEELIREFVDVALPNGPNTLKSSPLID